MPVVIFAPTDEVFNIGQHTVRIDPLPGEPNLGVDLRGRALLADPLTNRQARRPATTTRGMGVRC